MVIARRMTANRSVVASLESYMLSQLDRITAEANTLRVMSRSSTLLPRHIECAVRLLLRGMLYMLYTWIYLVIVSVHLS